MRLTRRGFIGGAAGLIMASVLPGKAGAVEGRAGGTGSGGRITAIDTHAHVFRRGLKLADVRRYAPDYDATPEDYLRQLDHNGISHGVLIQPSFLGTDNSYVLEALRKYPVRLRGVAVVQPNIAKTALVDMDREGIVGIRLNLMGLPVPDFRSDPWPSLLRTVVDLGWHVELHRHAADLAKIVDVLLKSGVNIVLDHFGLPDQKLGVNDPGFRSLLASAESSRRVWLKLSGLYRNGAAGVGEKNTMGAIPLLRQSFGVDRLVWGSDWPHTAFEKVMEYSKARAHLDMWLPDKEERKTVLVDTPARLFRFCGKRG